MQKIKFKSVNNQKNAITDPTFDGKFSTQINLPKSVQTKINKWKLYNIDANPILNYNFSDDLHVTILFGLLNPNIIDIQTAIEQEYGKKEITYSIGKLGIFEAENVEKEYLPEPSDVIYAQIISEDLHHLHDILAANFEFNSSYRAYKPHITIAYAEKDSCNFLIGKKIFKECTIKTNKFYLSDPAWIKTIIKL